MPTHFPQSVPQSLLNAESLPCYMQRGTDQDEPAQNIPYESHIFSPNISAYDSVILSILRHWQKYNAARKASCSTGPGHVQISNVVTYIVQLEWWTAWRYPESEKLNLTISNDFDNTKTSFCQSLLQRPPRTCCIHQQSNRAHYKTLALLAKILPT